MRTRRTPVLPVLATAAVATGAVRASAVTSSCTANGTGSRGSTTLVGSNLGVSSNPAPNTVRRVAGLGTVTINEQLRTNQPGRTTSITVNALHIRLSGSTLGTGDIVIGQSRCEANGPDVLLAADANAGAAGLAGSGSGSGVAGSGTPSGAAGSGNVGAAQSATPIPGTARFTG